MNLREVRKKIKSIANVKKITKAMQLVSAVKMKKAQQLATEGRPYRDSLEGIVRKVLPTVDPTSSPLLNAKEQAAEKELTIFVSSNKGLCGAFNMNLFRLILKSGVMKQMEYVTVGKKGATFASLTGGTIVADFSGSTPLQQVTAIFKLAVDQFLEGRYNKVSLVYNKFLSTLRSEAVHETLLPLTLRVEGEQKPEESEYAMEPSKELLFARLLDNYLEEKIRGAILNSEAAEHSSRMIAMKNATDNATEVIYSLTLLRNKLRQQKITYELLDMITAKESVESN